MKLLSTIILLLAVNIFSSCKDHPSGNRTNKDDENMYETDLNDRAMNNAIATAQQTLGSFDTALLSNNYDTSTFALKVKYPIKTGNEHIWTAHIQLEDDHYYGTISNIPEETTAVKQGDRVLINKTDITDWMYTDNGKLRGGYTIKVIYHQMSPKEQADMQKDLPYKIED